MPSINTPGDALQVYSWLAAVNTALVISKIFFIPLSSKEFVAHKSRPIGKRVRFTGKKKLLSYYLTWDSLRLRVWFMRDQRIFLVLVCTGVELFHAPDLLNPFFFYRETLFLRARMVRQNLRAKGWRGFAGREMLSDIFQVFNYSSSTDF